MTSSGWSWFQDGLEFVCWDSDESAKIGFVAHTCWQSFQTLVMEDNTVSLNMGSEQYLGDTDGVVSEPPPRESIAATTYFFM